MNWISNDVATVAIGLAACGPVPALCEQKGKRYALPHSRIMMHQPSGGLGGTASDIRIQAEQSPTSSRPCRSLIAEHTGQTLEQIEADSDRDRWFTAEQALALRASSITCILRLRSPFRGAPNQGKRSEIHEGTLDHRGSRLPDVGALRRWCRTAIRPTMDYNPQGRAAWYGSPDRPDTRSSSRTGSFSLDPPISSDIANAVMAQLLCLQQMDLSKISRSTSTLGRVLHALPRSTTPCGTSSLTYARCALGQAPRPLRCSGRRNEGQAISPAEQPDPDSPAGDRRRVRTIFRHRDPGEGRSCGFVLWMEEHALQGYGQDTEE